MDKRIENHIIQQYYDNQSLYRSLKHDITDIIENIITKNNIKISNFAIRIKTEDALRRKICLKHKYKDVNDILKTAKEQLMNTEALLFNGEPASEEAIQSILDAMEMGMALAKEKNKKYAPNKYKK